MAWLHEHGLISNFDDYAALPAIELQKARLWAEADMAYQKKQHDAAKQAGRVNRGKRR